MIKYLIVIPIIALSACSDRKGLETGEKLYDYYCISCHTPQENQFIKDISMGALTRRSSLKVKYTILDDEAHGSPSVKKLNELSQKESELLVKYLYKLKVEYENFGEIRSFNPEEKSLQEKK